MSDKPSDVATGGYFFGYFSGFFGGGGARATQTSSSPALTSCDAPPSNVNLTESKLFEPSTPTAEDWTFGLFRRESREESFGIQRHNSWNGFSLFGLSGTTKAPEIESAMTDKKNAENVTWTFFDDEKMKPAALDSAKAFDKIDPVNVGVTRDTLDGYQKGDIMSAYMAQAGVRVTELGTEGKSSTVGMAIEGDVVVSKKPRRSIFDNERIVVNRKEINMIAPTSM